MNIVFPPVIYDSDVVAVAVNTLPVSRAHPPVNTTAKLLNELKLPHISINVGDKSVHEFIGNKDSNMKSPSASFPISQNPEAHVRPIPLESNVKHNSAGGLNVVPVGAKVNVADHTNPIRSGSKIPAASPPVNPESSIIIVVSLLKEPAGIVSSTVVPELVDDNVPPVEAVISVAFVFAGSTQLAPGVAGHASQTSPTPSKSKSS